MLRLKDRSRGVPDLYRYTHTESGFVSTGVNWWDWWDSIVKHRRANGYPPITEAQAEDQLCKQIGPAFCEQEQPGDFRFVNTRLRFGDIVRGAKAYLTLIASGFQTVRQEEADRRARVCAGCYLRIIPQGCGSCVKLGSLIVGDIAGKKTAYDAQLENRACAACQCPLQPLVHFPLALLEQTDNDALQDSLPDFCWRKRSGENYQS